MDSRFLSSLVAVVETGSITAAARREKLTPAAISQRIQALERSLGCTLLARSAHAIRPTETCLSLLPRIRHLIRETELLCHDAQGGGLVGELRIGAISTALTGLFPAAINAIARQAPRLKLRLVPGSSLHLFEQVLAGSLDAAILVEPPFAVPKALRYQRLCCEPLVYVSRSEIDSADIARHAASQPFIRYDPSTWGGRLVALYLEQIGLAPEILCDLDELETIAILVGQGLGNALLPAWNGLARPGLCLTPVADAASFHRPLCLLQPAIPTRPEALSLLYAALCDPADR